MPNKWIPWVKVLVHAVCLIPLLDLYRTYKSGSLVLLADPVNYVTHQTGFWALWLLIASLAVTPVRRLHTKLANLVRFRRLLGLYAFFYATLHLATYVFLFSGYDVTAVWAGLRAGHPGVIVDTWKQVWPTIQDDLKKRWFIQVGLGAYTILLALAITSPAFVMRAMGGKAWRRLHSLVYIAGLAGITHWWLLVKKGVKEPGPVTAVLFALLLARVAWWAKEKVKKRRATAVAAAATRVQV
jgi:methionine sulfoxide reductase heme-binding subunit